MDFKQAKNSRIQGNIGMGAAIAYFTSICCPVSIPITDSQEYDLVIEDKNKSLKKVQVKTTGFKSEYGVYQVMLKTCGGNQSRNIVKTFENNKSDVVFILTDNGTQYLIPRIEIKAKHTLNLGKQYDKYKL